MAFLMVAISFVLHSEIVLPLVFVLFLMSPNWESDSVLLPPMLLLTAFCVVTVKLTSESQEMTILGGVGSLLCLGFFLAKNSLLLFLFFEVSLIPIFFIIGGWGIHQQRMKAMTMVLVYMVFCSSPLILSLIMSKTEMSWSQGSSLLLMVMLNMAFFVKLPAIGLHYWLPQAHVESPTSGSIILAALMLKLGSLGIMKMLTQVQNIFIPTTMSLAGMVLSSMMCFCFSDMKKVIALSSVSHMSLVPLVCSLQSLYTEVFILMISVTHGIVSGLLFMLMGTFSHSIQSRQINSIAQVVSSKKEWLTTSLLLLSNLGLPGTIAFFPEIQILPWTMNYMSLLGVWLSIYMLVVTYYNMWLLTSTFGVNKKTIKQKMKSLVLLSVYCIIPTSLLAI